MKSVIILATAILCAGIIIADSNSLPLSGPYFGQTPPGLTPERFAVGILENDLHGCPVFTADGLEAYWSVMSGTHVFTSAEIDGRWSLPATASLVAGLINSDAPALSPNGQQLLFISRNDPGPGLEIKENIWVANRTGGSWSSPGPLPSAVNGRSLHWQLSVADNGNLYYHSLDGGSGDIYMAQFSEGQYLPSQPLPAEINTTFYEHAPFIAPDESYIIFSRIDFSNNLMAELHISFRNPDSSWSEAVSMDELNRSGSNETAPNVTRDGLYLFYLGNTSQGLSAHWVSAAIIESYRPHR